MLVQARTQLQQSIPLSEIMGFDVRGWAFENNYNVGGMLINIVWDDMVSKQLTDNEVELYRYNWQGDMEIVGDQMVFTYWPEIDIEASDEKRWACPVCQSEVSSLEDGTWVCNGWDGTKAADWTGELRDLIEVYEWDDEAE